jgi:hypothetical protein
MSKITQCSIWATIDSHITVTNADGTSVTFTTPAVKDKTFDQYYTELRTLADAYISAFDERTVTTNDNTPSTHGANV